MSWKMWLSNPMFGYASCARTPRLCPPKKACVSITIPHIRKPSTSVPDAHALKLIIRMQICKSTKLRQDIIKSSCCSEQPQDVSRERAHYLGVVEKLTCSMCFCGENEGSERAAKMVACKLCCKKYHRSCLKGWAQNRDLFHWSSWACPSCKVCEVCRRTGYPNKLMYCKRCDGAHHWYCQQPPHKNVSTGPYLCPKHTKCHSCGSTVPGSGLSTRWFLGYNYCDACGRLIVKGKYCPVCLKEFIEASREPSVTFTLAKFNGILGLGFQEISVGNVVPVWYNMVKQGLVKELGFSFWFHRNVEEEDVGELVSGEVDQNQYKGKHTYVPVPQKGHWQFDMGDVLFGGKSTGFYTGGCAAIADSGTPLLAGPTTIITEIDQSIGAAGIVCHKCKSVVAQYGEQIMELLLAETQPKKICSKSGLCTFDVTRYVSIGIESVVDEKNVGKSSCGLKDVICSTCEMTVVWMPNQHRQNQTQEHILDYINELCDHLPSLMGESVVDCSMINVSFTLSGKESDLAASQYILKVGEGPASQCTSGFTALDVPPPRSPLCILGDIFMGHDHTVFDYGI